MKYKGFNITPFYHVGSTYRLVNGRRIDRKPTSKDIAYYEIYDPMENNRRHGAEFTIKECKQRIDEMLKEMGMKDNTQESWDKLEN